MRSLIGRVFSRLTGDWRLAQESLVPRNQLQKARNDSSKTSLGFFALLICSAVIATLGLIANSTAVVIGAMVVAPLMDPILSFAFGLTTSDTRLVKRSALTLLIGVFSVIVTAWILAAVFGASVVNQEITSRTAPNLIDLVIAVTAGVAGAFTITLNRSNSIAGVAIAVALVPPLCVCGIGLSLGPELVISFGRGAITGLTNQVAEGSFLLFLANMIGIIVTSLVVFMLQGYGSVRQAWRHFLVWIGLLGLLCIPLSSALKEFSMRQKINIGFTRFKAGLVDDGLRSDANSRILQRLRLLYSNVQIPGNLATIDIVMNVPEQLMGVIRPADIKDRMKRRAKAEYGIDEVVINISVIPTQILR